MTEKKKGKKIRITGIVLALLILCTAGIMAMNLMGGAPIAMSDPSGGRGGRPGSAGRGGQEEAVVYSVRVETAQTGTLEDYLKINGDVVAETSVDIFPDTSGKLTSLSVSLGDYVRKGEIIAEVDPSLPGQVYVESPVRSTISGTITDLPFKVGATVSSTQVPVATVGDLGDLEIQSFISEKEMASIETGLKAEIVFEPFRNELFTGRITEVSPVLDRSSRTLEIKISLDEKDRRIKSGMFGSVRLITDVLEEALIISSDSLTTASEGTFVYVVGEDSTVEQRFVDTGLIIDGKAEILSGLTEGELVVSRGQSMLRSGSTVRVTA